MTVIAPVPVSAVAELLKVAALPLPRAGAGPEPTVRVVDQLVLSPEPTVEALVQLAATGQHNLASLLPTLEHMLAADTVPRPLGHLAQAVGDAAHWVDAGASHLLGIETPDLSPAWRQTARTGLHEAAQLLATAERRLDTIPQPAAAPNPDILWAMSQVAGARRQVGLALGALAARPRPQPVRPAGRPADIGRALAIVGLAVMLLLLGLAYGTWLGVAAVIGTVVTLAGAWRIVVSSRRLRLELRR